MNKDDLDGIHVKLQNIHVKLDKILENTGAMNKHLKRVDSTFDWIERKMTIIDNVLGCLTENPDLLQVTALVVLKLL